MRYKSIRLTNDEADALVEKWRRAGFCESYCENHHGNCYWNRATGEILWYASEEGESNACVLA